jgi:dTMP kinase
MNKLKKGFFISFEGPEASGKSTQIKLISKFLKKNNIKHVVTREPGGTKISEKIRNIILDNKNISPTEEILLLMSSRLNHINNVILPALLKNKIVISDRFADSTFVYQGHVNKYGIKKTMDLHKKILNNFLPNKTFLFILPSETINKRLRKRIKANKYDKIDKNFHTEVIKGYKKISKNDKRFITLNALESKEDINLKIIEKLKKLINL